jgi:dipeptidase E
MKRLFLTSQLRACAVDIAARISERKLLFITTSSEGKSGDLEWLRKDREAIVAAGFLVTDFTITGKTLDEIRNAFELTEIICMEGGDTGYLLMQIQKTGCAEVIKEAVLQGKLYIGSSAGSMVTTPDITLTTDGDRTHAWGLTDFTGLQLVDFHLFVHVQRERYAPRLVAYAQGYASMHGEKVIPLQDSQYVYVEDDMYKIVTV